MANPKKSTKKNKTVLATIPDDPLLMDLNDAQRAAVTFGQGPLLIVAGAGTGKTSVITRRIAHLIASGNKAEDILALTFTEKAATEMEERVDAILPYGYYDLWISTFHAFCERILKQHALDIGLPNDFKTLDSTQQKILIHQNLHRFELNYYKPLGNPTRFISAIVDHFSSLKDEEISPEQYIIYAQSMQAGTMDGEVEIDEQEIERTKEIASAYGMYQKLLLERGALDFGDLINSVLRLFRSRPRILSYYQKKFKYILVDEFQDTNFAQYDLVKMLATPVNNLTVVGDDDQSIYKFRGASISNILHFQQDYPNTREITLNENYRSGQVVLDASYNVIQLNNPDRLEAKLGLSKKLHSNIKEIGEVGALVGNTLNDEVDTVINKIIQIRKSQKSNWNDFAILVRANSHAEPFISKLASLGLPYIYYANKGLYRKPIVVDIIQYIRVLLDYHDSSALYRVLSMDPFCLDHQDLMFISHHAHKYTMSLYDALIALQDVSNIKEETSNTIKHVLKLLSEHGPLIRQKSSSEAFVIIVKDLGIAQRVEPETIQNAENRELIEQIYRKVETFESDAVTDKSMRAFVELLDFEQDAGEEGKLQFDPQSSPESINILTIHASKGLEFKHVFVVNMVSRRFPSTERHDLIEIPTAMIREILPGGEAHIQEERRLLYVAMTRAKHSLYFSYASDYGGARTVKPSQFLVELGMVSKPEKTSVISREEASLAVPKIYVPSDHLPDTFSFTQLSDFKTCPMRFKYRHWLKLPLPGSSYLSFGNTIHKTLELFLSAYIAESNSRQGDLFKKDHGALPTLDELSALYERCWVDEWYETKEQKEEYRDNGKKIIKSFYETFVKDPVIPKYIEKSFRLPIGKYFFVGKIDRADPSAEGLSIIDYKTGKEKDLDKDGKDQLLIYQWAAQEYMKEKVSALRYWYLLDNKYSETFLGDEAELTAIKEHILSEIEDIRQAIIHNTFKELDKKAPKHKCDFEDLG